jgi:hypothetical protein
MAALLMGRESSLSVRLEDGYILQLNWMLRRTEKSLPEKNCLVESKGF